jgi:4-hydroxybenzoate polyprenyltransferase
MSLERFKQYAYLLRLHKPIGTLLLLWPTLWALWLASEGPPPRRLLWIFVAGVVVMRAAGCVINDFADRHFDGQVRRTAYRPLAMGKITTVEAGLLFVILGFLALLLAWQLNPLTLCCAFIGAGVTILYPFMKRFTHWPQLGLGVAYTWGVVMAFTAVQGKLNPAAWLLFFTALLWPLIYDTFYAMVDREDDLRIGVKSTAILFGSADRAVTGVLQALFLLGLSVVGWVFHLGLPYYLSLVLAGLLFCYQQNLIRTREPAACFKAFLNNNWVGAVIFLGITLARI